MVTLFFMVVYFEFDRKYSSVAHWLLISNFILINTPLENRIGKIKPQDDLIDSAFSSSEFELLLTALFKLNLVLFDQ